MTGILGRGGCPIPLPVSVAREYQRHLYCNNRLIYNCFILFHCYNYGTKTILLITIATSPERQLVVLSGSGLVWSSRWLLLEANKYNYYQTKLKSCRRSSQRSTQASLRIQNFLFKENKSDSSGKPDKASVLLSPVVLEKRIIFTPPQITMPCMLGRGPNRGPSGDHSKDQKHEEGAFKMAKECNWKARERCLPQYHTGKRTNSPLTGLVRLSFYPHNPSMVSNGSLQR